MKNSVSTSSAASRNANAERSGAATSRQAGIVRRAVAVMPSMVGHPSGRGLPASSAGGWRPAPARRRPAVRVTLSLSAPQLAAIALMREAAPRARARRARRARGRARAARPAPGALARPAHRRRGVRAARAGRSISRSRPGGGCALALDAGALPAYRADRRRPGGRPLRLRAPRPGVALQRRAHPRRCTACDPTAERCSGRDRRRRRCSRSSPTRHPGTISASRPARSSSTSRSPGRRRPSRAAPTSTPPRSRAPACGRGRRPHDPLNLWLPSEVAPDGAPALVARGMPARRPRRPASRAPTSSSSSSPCPDDLYGSSQYEPRAVRVLAPERRRRDPRAAAAARPRRARRAARSTARVACAAPLERVRADGWLGDRRRRSCGRSCSAGGSASAIGSGAVGRAAPRDAAMSPREASAARSGSPGPIAGRCSRVETVSCQPSARLDDAADAIAEVGDVEDAAAHADLRRGAGSPAVAATAIASGRTTAQMRWPAARPGAPGRAHPADRRRAPPRSCRRRRRRDDRRRRSGWRRRRSRRRTPSAGARRPPAGARAARCSPSCMIATRSDMKNASSWSWVT